jgi:hypothetical protein
MDPTLPISHVRVRDDVVDCVRCEKPITDDQPALGCGDGPMHAECHDDECMDPACWSDPDAWYDGLREDRIK